MIEFLNPFLFGSLAALSAPVIIHLWHRRRIQRVQWGAMRFLIELLAQHRRRLFVEDLLLLLVRILILTCLALALVRPAFHRLKAESNGRGVARQGRTAAVLLVDDSVSSAAGRAQPALESMKQLGLAYLDSLAPGDEVSLMLMSQLGAAPSDPVFDLEGMKAHLAGLKPAFVATDIAALLDAGLSQLKRHVNPGTELVLLTDGREDGWQEGDKLRWKELRARLGGTKKGGVIGTRSRPQVIVLCPEMLAAGENLGILAIGMDRTLVSVGKPSGLRVTVGYWGQQLSREVTVQLRINGAVIESKRVAVPKGGEQDVVFTHTFTAVGSYAIEAALLDAEDILPADDRRAFSVQVEASVPVLLVDGGSAQGLEGKLGFLSYALDPEQEGRGAFKLTRIPAPQFRASLLQDYRVIVLGDVKVLEPAMVDALERFVVSGGGVLVGLGPDSDLALINRYWARNGEGFLPCPLEPRKTLQKPMVPATLNLSHPVFSGFGSKSDEAWRGAKVRSYCQLNTRATKTADLEILLGLQNGDPLVIERRRGLGLVALVATSLNADWSELPLQAAYVPLMRGIIGHLGSFVIPPRNLVTGEAIVYARVKDPAQRIQAEDPTGKALKLSLGAWEGRNAVLSEPLMEPGVYVLHDAQMSDPIRYAVAQAPSESPLLPISDSEVSRFLDGKLTLLHSADQIAASLDPNRRQSVELWKWFLLGAVSLMFAEGWLTRPDATAT
jgi:Aerotolerance regulator N-terminal